MRGSEQVQVQLRLPLTSEPREQRCSSSTAHESLRRFAEGYVFGSSSRIGANNLLDASRQDPVTHCAPVFACDNRADFTSCAAKKDEEKREKTTRRRRPDGRRSALVFGENAPKVTLPVKDRIERKTTPKRYRECVSVDALSAMMEQLFCHSGSVNGGVSRGDDDNELTKTLCDMKIRRKPGKGSKTVKVARTDGVDKGKENGKEVIDEMTKLEDDDTADELSFLVNRCDLDSDKTRGPFMPYIT